jgi:hypothetical protein
MKRSLSVTLFAITCCLLQAHSNQSSMAPGYSDSIIVQPVKDAVKIFPNPTHNGTVSVSMQASSGKLHFYIFDLEGTLVHQAVLNPKQKETVRNLKKGVYMYDVFRNDISIEHGKIIVK